MSEKKSNSGCGCATFILAVILVIAVASQHPGTGPGGDSPGPGGPSGRAPSAGPDLRVSGIALATMTGQKPRAGQPIVLWIDISNLGNVASGQWRVLIKRSDQYGMYQTLILDQPRPILAGTTEMVLTTNSVLGDVGPPAININQPGSFRLEVIIQTLGDVNPGNNSHSGTFIAY